MSMRQIIALSLAAGAIFYGVQILGGMIGEYIHRRRLERIERIRRIMDEVLDREETHTGPNLRVVPEENE